MNTSVAVGIFDGLHLGHARLFERALTRADGGRCVALSFDPHPDVVLGREFRSLPPLTPIPEKQERLAGMGIELHVLPFTRELAGTSPETFVAEQLVQVFRPRWLVVGNDFALGRGRSGNVDRLREIGRGVGFEVEAVPLLEREGGPVSSTRVRERLLAGDVGGAARLLGRRYGLGGLVVPGDRIGRSLGFPTANLRRYEERQLPRDGIYAAWARIDRDPVRLRGALSLGTRPTIGAGARVIEVHLLDWDGDLYGRDVEVEFVEWIRGQEDFGSLPALATAIARDVERIRRALPEAALTPWPSSPRNA